jgi:hypothetical protein
MVRVLYFGKIFLSSKEEITEKNAAKTKNKLPVIVPSTPLSKKGIKTMVSTPKKLTKVPTSVFIFNFSLRYSTEPIIKIIGAAERIIGALILDESFKPKFKNEIVKVIPVIEAKISGIQSLVFIFKSCLIKKNKIIADTKNLRKTKLNGGMLSSVNL